MCEVRRAVSGIALGLALVAGTTACTTAAGPPHANPATTSAAHTAVVTRLTRALRSCGLSTSQSGVTETRRSVRLSTPVNGHPTSVDRADVACTLAALDLPRADRDLFWSTSISGGYQTVTWGAFSADWHFRDTLTFDVDLYPAP